MKVGVTLAMNEASRAYNMPSGKAATAVGWLALRTGAVVFRGGASGG